MRHAWVLTLSLLALPLFAGCSDSGDSNGSPVGADCRLDSDCPEAQICGSGGTCEACTACELTSDCGAATMTCLSARSCCKTVECTEDAACAEPGYCFDLTCREKPCTGDDECTREGHGCLNHVCGHVTCATDADCESNLCETATRTCRTCVGDSECHNGLRCQDGTCVGASDGDVEREEDVELQGCAAYQTGCMFETLSCFDKIWPAESYVSCEPIKMDGAQIGYLFTFSDGAQWKQIDSPDEYFEARTDTFCYRIRREGEGVMAYTDRTDAPLGRYVLHLLQDGTPSNVLSIICPDGSEEWYDMYDLETQGCDGFQYTGLYVPPPPGYEQCSK